MQIDSTLSGKICLVTGAGAGIGRAAALSLAKTGAYVYLCDKSPKMLETTLNRINQDDEANQASACPADISDEDQVASMFTTIRSEKGGLDILVHCAAIQQESSFFDLKPADWRRTLDVNLTGTFLVSQAAARLMKETADLSLDCNGKIITLTSVHDQLPRCGKFDYDAAKAGVSALTREMALALSPWRINVNAIAPGVIDTPMNKDVMDHPDTLKAAAGRVPWSRVGTAGEVAGLIRFLASSDANYMTGCILPIDGGRSLNSGSLPQR